jgi:hypothetical protein
MGILLEEAEGEFGVTLKLLIPEREEQGEEVKAPTLQQARQTPTEELESRTLVEEEEEQGELLKLMWEAPEDRGLFSCRTP